MSTNLESYVFQNQQTPQSVLILSKIMPQIPQNVLNAMLKLVFDIIRKRPVGPKTLEVLSKKYGISENVDHLFCGLLMLMQAVLRLPLDSIKENELKQGLKELKFTEDNSSEFIKVMQENIESFHRDRRITGGDNFLKLTKFNWRIDITISSNHLSKALETVIIFQMKLNDNESKSFEVSIAKFHQLRFYVSSMLKELEFLEKKNVFKQ